MTEADWLTGNNPWGMLDAVAGGASRRKLQLLSCGIVRHKLDKIDEDNGWGAHLADAEARRRCSEMIVAQARKVITLVEETDPISLSQARCLLEQKSEALLRIPLGGQHMLYSAIRGEVTFVKHLLGEPPRQEEEKRHASSCFTEVFGNPFRLIAIDSAWQTEAVVGIASGIYEDRAFERMPILADALQEVGCEHPDILSHCREPGVHVRGCWVVDLVLGKS